MKAVVYKEYGPPEVLRIEEVERPTPRDKEVLIKIYAAAVAVEDSMIRGSRFGTLTWLPMRLMFGLTKPKKPIPGFELAGEIVAVGGDVKRFSVGDQVFGINVKDAGAHAQYTCLAEDKVLAAKPNDKTYEEAIATIGAIMALPALRDNGNVQSGHKVLVNGASGSVGTAAVQVAKYYGAEVTGVCSTSNMRLVKSLGADHVIDYTEEDFSEAGREYDIIFDTVGKTPFARCKRVLEPGGTYLTTVPTLSVSLQMKWTSMTSGKKAMAVTNAYRPASDISEDLAFVARLVEEGHLSPVIDRTYPLEQIVEAHRYVDGGHKKGNVIVIPHRDGSGAAADG